MAPKPPPGRNGFKYRPQWAVIVVCDDEDHQRTTYETLQAMGLRLRVVAV